MLVLPCPSTQAACAESVCSKADIPPRQKPWHWRPATRKLTGYEGHHAGNDNKSHPAGVFVRSPSQIVERPYIRRATTNEWKYCNLSLVLTFAWLHTLQRARKSADATPMRRELSESGRPSFEMRAPRYSNAALSSIADPSGRLMRLA